LKKLLAGLAVVIVTAGAWAQGEPIQLSLTPDIALHARGQRIEGFSLSVWGENPQAGFALGLVNGSTDDSAGLSLGLVNYAANYTGVQWGVLNFTKGDFLGWQVGPLWSVVNYTGGTLRGLQTGLVNYAGELTGLQFGLVNLAASANAGFQLGLVNVIRANQFWFTELPNELAPATLLVNWRF